MPSITNDPQQSVTEVTDHLRQVRQRLARAARSAGRDPSEIHLLAVSKGQSLAKIRAVYAAGQRSFGENYLQEAVKKIDAFRETDIEWHFIGKLQSNKARRVAEEFAWVHTVDRIKVAERLNGYRPHYAQPLNVCLQINVAGEIQKAGVEASRVPELAAAVADLPKLRLRGLMTIPPPADDPAESAPHFRQLRLIRDQLTAAGYALDTLSIGMSGDLEVAIQEGATLVRVGTAVFGPRLTTPGA